MLWLLLHAQWEHLKMAGMAPGPRASFCMAAHRQRAILFGGITDQPGKVRFQHSKSAARCLSFDSVHRW